MIDNVKTSFNKKFDSLQTNLTQKIDNIQLAISKLTSMHTVQENGKFPSQPQQNPKRVHEIGETSENFAKVDEVKAIITLRGCNQVDKPLPNPKKKKRKGNKKKCESTRKWKRGKQR